MSAKQKLNDAYERLQGLEIRATRGNLENLLQCLYDLQDVYNELEGVGADGGQTNSDE